VGGPCQRCYEMQQQLMAAHRQLGGLEGRLGDVDTMQGVMQAMQLAAQTSDQMVLNFKAETDAVVTQLRQQVERLLSEAAEGQQREEQLRGTIDQQQQTIVELQGSLREQDIVAEELQGTVRQQRGALEVLRASVAEKERSTAELQTARSLMNSVTVDERSEFGVQILSLQSTVNRLQGELDLKIHEVSHLQGELSEKVLEVSQLQRSSSQKSDHEVDALREKHATELREARRCHDDELCRHKARVAELQAQLLKATLQHQDLHKMLQQSASSIGGLASQSGSGTSSPAAQPISHTTQQASPALSSSWRNESILHEVRLTGETDSRIIALEKAMAELQSPPRSPSLRSVETHKTVETVITSNNSSSTASKVIAWDSPVSPSQADRMKMLRKVFRAFDSRGSGRVVTKDLMALGKRRKELGQTTARWTEEKNSQLLLEIDPSGEGMVNELVFVSHYVQALQGLNDAAFADMIADFLLCAKARAAPIDSLRSPARPSPPGSPVPTRKDSPPLRPSRGHGPQHKKGSLARNSVRRPGEASPPRRDKRSQDELNQALLNRFGTHLVHDAK